MPSFAENLAGLPSVDQYSRMELYGESLEPVAVIENLPGSQGSLRIYYQVSLKWGGIGPAAAREALALFGKYALESQHQPGTHPNIDRLYRIIENNEYYSVRCYPRDG